jgi:hypothetical protein
MNNNNSTTIIVIVIILAVLLFGGFGMMGFGQHMMGGYGSTRLCGSVGGIWCYWPDWVFVFNLIVSILVVIILVLVLVLLIKKLNRRGKFSGKRKR